MAFRSLICTVIAAATLALSACGGGGGGDDTRSTPPPVTQTPPPPKTFVISGHVVGVTDATLSVSGAKSASLVSDNAGGFSFSDLPAGEYRVRAVRPGSIFKPVEQAVTISNSDVTGLVFESQVPGEGLSEADLDRLDKEPSVKVTPEAVILPNGQTLKDFAASHGYPLGPKSTSPDGPSKQSVEPQATAPTTGPQEQKNVAVMKMLATAMSYACGRDEPTPCTTWDYPEDKSDKDKTQPAQKGLTYVYGGKTPEVRTRPVDGCPEYTYGMDCSGLVLKAAAAAGITAPATSATQANPDGWTLPKDSGLKLTKVTDDSIQAGDVVLWASHAGIASSSSVVISSTGGSGQCATNIKPKKGPRALTIAQLKLGKPTTVLRLVAPLSGDWELDLRCSSASTDAARINFKIDNDKGGAFASVGSGTDYDGRPLSFNLKGSYDLQGNILAATLSLTDNSRSDTFTQKLLFDESEYFPLTKGIDNGGCPLSAKLIRLTAPAPKGTGEQPQSAPVPQDGLHIGAPLLTRVH
jgi:hypothetical protein